LPTGKKEVFDGQATVNGISPTPTSAPGRDLVFTDTLQTDTMKILSNGTLYHNEPIVDESVTAMGQNVPSGAMFMRNLRDTSGNQMLFSMAALAIPAPLATNTSGSTIISGDLPIAKTRTAIARWRKRFDTVSCAA
jgi:hypothetical protein